MKDFKRVVKCGRIAAGVCLAVLIVSVVHASSMTIERQPHWGEALLVEALSSGLLKGYSDGSIKPDQSITRAEFATLVARGFHPEESVSHAGRTWPRFSDVPSSHWAKGYVEMLAEKGYILGTSSDTASPDEPITRAEVACILDRMLEALNVPPGSGVAGFTDTGDIPAWAVESVDRLAARQVFLGDDQGRFVPSRSITRAEAVATILRSLETVGKRWHLEGIISYANPTGRSAGIECENEVVTIFYDSHDIYVYRGNEVAGVGSLRKGDKVSIVLKEGGKNAGFILIEQ